MDPASETTTPESDARIVRFDDSSAFIVDAGATQFR
jgi:hypothetical protein